MGLFSDILESNRERGNYGYIDPCMIVSSFNSTYHTFDAYRKKLQEYKETNTDTTTQAKIKQEFIQKSAELESLKAGYLVAEKSILEIVNRQKIQSVYMKDMLNTLLFQLRGAYKAICKLRSEIDKNIGLNMVPTFEPEDEAAIRNDMLNKLIDTTLHHMEEGTFVDTSMFRKVVSDCAEVIRCLKNEEYRSNDKSVFTYYLMETVGLKPSQHKCRNCGMELLDNTGYCLNCYERNV